MGTTRLGDYRERFEAMVKVLKKNKRVKVLCAWLGRSIDPTKVVAAAQGRGVELSPDAVEFYSRMNGCALIWAPIDDPQYDPSEHKAYKGRPPMQLLESLPTDTFRIIAMPPIEEVMTKSIDYAAFMEGSPPRLGFDFPGTYLTPALVVQDGRVHVEVGDDHGACWDGRSSSFADYVETVLATWGDVGALRRIFLRRALGVGRDYFANNPVALATLLPLPPSADAKAQAKLARALRRGYLADVSDDDVDAAVVAVRSENVKLADLALDKLAEQPRRIVRHAHAIFQGLVDSPSMQQDYFPKLNYRTKVTRLVAALDGLGAELTLEQRTLILRDPSRIWATRGRVAANAGVAILPTLREMLEDDSCGANEDRAHAAALHAAMLLGPQAAELLPLVERYIQPLEVAAEAAGTNLQGDRISVSLVASLAALALSPSRADELLPYLLIALGREPRDEPLEYAGILAALPPALQHEAMQALLDVAREGRIAMLPERLQLLASLSEPAIFVMIDWLREPAPQGAPAHKAILRALSDLALSDEQRTTAAGIAKQIYLAQSRAEFLAFAYLFGGPTCAPEVDAKAAIVQLSSAARTMRSEKLAKSTLSVLQGRIEQSQLNDIVQALRWQDWKWLQDYAELAR